MAVISGSSIARRNRIRVFLANLGGAVLTFFYFRVIDPAAFYARRPPGAWEIAFSVVAFAALAWLGMALAARWTRPLEDFRAGHRVDIALARRRALLLPYVVAGHTLIGWVFAGLIWGVLLPSMEGGLSAAGALRGMFGITVIAGTVTTALVFFAVEAAWRPVLPAFFPEGDLSTVPRAPRLPVQTRLLVIFLLVGIDPLVLVGVLAYTRTAALAGAPPSVAAVLIGDLRLTIAFMVVVGAATAVGLAVYVARSVAAPLRDVEAAMVAVGDGDLSRRCAVVSTDEIGTVAEGFNRMAHGLRERERIRDAFGKYVSREVRDAILAGRVALDGETVEVTILFSDLRDFTPWVEATPPREVVRDLNEYFTEMEGAIRAEGGLVLQFIGDEIEAVFGAPIAAPDHAARAVRAAHEMRRRLAGWNARRAAAGKAPLRHGIGVHTGTVLAGNIGSAERLSWALVGDAVNLASRIQGLTKESGTDVLLSAATRERLQESVALEALPAVRVKGRTAEVAVYRLA
jgi:adenylate cyclase